jgi:signal transduction histidine kinase
MRRYFFFLPLHRPTIYAFVVGSGMSFALFFYLVFHQMETDRANFERRAKFRLATVERGMERVVQGLNDVRRFVAANEHAGRPMLDAFLQQVQENHPYVLLFGFEPLSSHELKVESNTRTATTQLLPLPLLDRSELGLRIVMPVHKHGGLPQSDDVTRGDSMTGQVVATMRARDLFEHLLTTAGSNSTDGFDIRIYAAPTPEAKSLAYSSFRLSDAAPTPFIDAWLFGNRPDPLARSYRIAGQPWHFTVSLRPARFADVHAYALFVLLMGMLTAVAGAAYVQVMATHTERIEQIVAQRTEELEQANVLLTRDVEARRLLEAELVASGERAREVADMAADWYWEMDEHFRYTVFEAGVRRGGPPAAGLLPIDATSPDWLENRALLEARKPFRNFEFKTRYKTMINGVPVSWIKASGKPIFDSAGRFKGFWGTGTNISARKGAEEELRQSRAEVSRLVEHLEVAKEDERKRIAREIHDDLGQNLMVLRIDVAMMAEHAITADARKKVDSALRQIDTTIKAVRAIINDLRPAVLDLGLYPAVEWQTKEFIRRTGIACELHIDHKEFPVDGQCAATLFRVVQEALNNTMRHASANHVRIGLKRMDGALRMQITDDGVGMLPGCRRRAQGFGLIGMEERIHTLGGTFSIVSEPGKGVSICLSIPVGDAMADRALVAEDAGCDSVDECVG